MQPEIVQAMSVLNLAPSEIVRQVERLVWKR